MPWTLLPPTILPGPLPTPIVDRFSGGERSGDLLDVPIKQSDSRFKFVITDMKGEVKGEVLDCSNKEFIQNLDNTQNGKFTVKLNNPLADYILNHDCLCKCYRQPLDRTYGYRLLLVGDVITDEEITNNETGSITFTVADPLNRMAWRLLGKDVDGSNHGLGWKDATALSPKDVMDIIGDMLLEVNADDLGFCGVILGDRVPFDTEVNTFVEPVFFQPFATQLAIYTATLGGFDFWMEPLEPQLWTGVDVGQYSREGNDVTLVPATNARDCVIARLNIYFPTGNFQRGDGSFSKNHPFPVFEYGVGKKNVQGYARTRDKSQLINQWYNLATGFPDANATTDPLVVSNPATHINGGYTVGDSIADRTGQESVTPGDLGVGEVHLRQHLVNATAQVSAVPRQQITFTPVINCDVDWTIDYFVGDVVIVRAYIQETNSWRFNGTARIYGVDATIDDDEQETIALTLIPTN